MIFRAFLAVFLFTVLGCATSMANLNKIAQDSLKSEKERKEQATSLNYKYLGADKNTILTDLGEPKEKSYKSYSYRLDLDCRGNNCEKGYSDEKWSYLFKKKVSNNWEVYSVYVYFKDGKVVRIR